MVRRRHDDDREGSGRNRQTTWMRWTSKRRSIRMHPSQHGGRSNTAASSASLSGLTYGYVHHGTSGRNHGTRLKNPWFTSKGISHLSCWLVMGETVRIIFLVRNGGEKAPTWECLFVHRQQGQFLSVYVDDINITRKTRNLESHMEEIDEAR